LSSHNIAFARVAAFSLSAAVEGGNQIRLERYETAIQPRCKAGSRRRKGRQDLVVGSCSTAARGDKSSTDRRLQRTETGKKDLDVASRTVDSRLRQGRRNQRTTLAQDANATRLCDRHQPEKASKRPRRSSRTAQLRSRRGVDKRTVRSLVSPKRQGSFWRDMLPHDPQRRQDRLSAASRCPLASSTTAMKAGAKTANRRSRSFRPNVHRQLDEAKRARRLPAFSMVAPTSSIHAAGPCGGCDPIGQGDGKYAIGVRTAIRMTSRRGRAHQLIKSTSTSCLSDDQGPRLSASQQGHQGVRTTRRTAGPERHEVHQGLRCKAPMTRSQGRRTVSEGNDHVPSNEA